MVQSRVPSLSRFDVTNTLGGSKSTFVSRLINIIVLGYSFMIEGYLRFVLKLILHSNFGTKVESRFSKTLVVTSISLTARLVPGIQ